MYCTTVAATVEQNGFERVPHAPCATNCFENHRLIACRVALHIDSLWFGVNSFNDSQFRSAMSFASFLSYCRACPRQRRNFGRTSVWIVDITIARVGVWRSQLVNSFVSAALSLFVDLFYCHKDWTNVCAQALASVGFVTLAILISG